MAQEEKINKVHEDSKFTLESEVIALENNMKVVRNPTTE